MNTSNSADLAFPINMEIHIPEAQNYPSEVIIEHKFKVWSIIINIYVLMMMLLVIFAIFRNKCEKEEKIDSYLQPIYSTFWYMMVESWGFMILMWTRMEWYQTTRLFGISKYFAIFQIVNVTMFIFAIISLSGLWSKCLHSHLIVVYIALAYRPFIMILVGYLLYKYPLLIKRIVWNKEELRPFNR